MRIVYYTHTAFFEVALSITRELARDAEVHLLLEVAPQSWRSAGFDLAPRPLPPGIVEADRALRDQVPPAVREYWRDLASFQIVSHTNRRSLHPDSFKVSRQVLAYASAVGADLLHVDDVDVTPRLAPVLPLAQNLPLVLSVHDPQPHTGERDWRKTLSRRLAYPRVDHFVLHNTRLRDDFRRRHGLSVDRVSVVNLGAYAILRAWELAPVIRRPNTVLFVGRLSPYKGLDVLYRAMPEVAARVPDVHFIVAGRPIPGYDPPRPPRLPDGATLTIDEEYQSNPQMARLLGGSTVVVCPYRDATQSGVLLAAYAFGTPVIATDIGGIPDYLENGGTGLLVPPDDPAALANAVVRLLRDDPERHRMQQRIEESASSGSLSWSRSAGQLMEVYGSVSRSRP